MKSLTIEVLPTPQGISDLIENLIDMLDAADGDPDREPDGTEADQSYPEDYKARFHNGSPLEDAEDGGDAEPSLGSIERHPQGASVTHARQYANGDTSQVNWSAGGTDDFEVNDDDEPQLDESDYEPSLAAGIWPEHCQIRWGLGSRNDGEINDDDALQAEPEHDEPSLAFPEGCQFAEHAGENCDRELDLDSFEGEYHESMN